MSPGLCVHLRLCSSRGGKRVQKRPTLGPAHHNRPRAVWGPAIPPAEICPRTASGAPLQESRPGMVLARSETYGLASQVAHASDQKAPQKFVFLALPQSLQQGHFFLPTKITRPQELAYLGFERLEPQDRSKLVEHCDLRSGWPPSRRQVRGQDTRDAGLASRIHKGGSILRLLGHSAHQARGG